MKIGFYAGSFDPFTNGHMYVVKEATILFDKVYIGMGINSNKKKTYDQEKMKELITKALKDENINNVEVVTYNDLSVDCAKRCNANYLIRGIRNGMDYDYEENLAAINEEISGLNTVYVRAGKMGFVSSSFVKDMINNGKNVEKYVPKAINEYIRKNV